LDVGQCASSSDDGTYSWSEFKEKMESRELGLPDPDPLPDEEDGGRNAPLLLPHW